MVGQASSVPRVESALILPGVGGSVLLFVFSTFAVVPDTMIVCLFVLAPVAT